MRRREFIAMIGGAAVGWPLAVRAQLSEAARHIGVLMTYAASDPEAELRVKALEAKLAELGWSIGRNLAIDYHFAGTGEPSALRMHAAQLVTAAPDVILCQSTPVLKAIQRENRTIPVIFVQVTDPVGAGFVQSLAKPGGQLTGFTDFEYDIGGKWIELIKSIDPGLTAITVIAMAGHTGNAGIFRAMETAAPSFGVGLAKVEIGKNSDLAQAFSGNADKGLIVLPSPAVIVYRDEILQFAARQRLRAVYPLRYFATSGGLMAYGIDQVDQWGRAASYIDRVVKGEKPADLPVQQPTKFELVINLKTAKALGLTVPPTLLTRADEVIE